jgi:hypothetical protein
MKPTFITTRNQKRFPKIDCNYRSATLSGYHGHCTKAAAPSFRNISLQYFQKEARHDFVGEAILFAILLVTAAVPVVSGAYAILELCRAFGGL